MGVALVVSPCKAGELHHIAALQAPMTNTFFSGFTVNDGERSS